MNISIAPPDQVVKLALEVASRSPCRSKRGVVLYDPHGAPSGAWHNGPPKDACPGSAICTGTCSQRAVHAEVRALRAAQIARTATAALGGRLEPLDLVHVERAADGCRFCAAGDRFIAPDIHLIGNGPGTLTCEAEASWHHYSAEEFFRLTLEQYPPTQK